jgi:hypothetical protein
MAISQNKGSISIVKHRRPFISALKSVVPEWAKKSTTTSFGAELAWMIRSIDLIGFCA